MFKRIKHRKERRKNIYFGGGKEKFKKGEDAGEDEKEGENIRRNDQGKKVEKNESSLGGAIFHLLFHTSAVCNTFR